MAYLKIRSLRKEKRITQKELGKIIGVSASTIGMYEQGRRMPPLDLLIELADCFGVPIDFIIGR